MVSLLRKIIGDSAEKVAEKIRPIAAQINAQESKIQQLSDDQLRAKTDEFKSRLLQGETLDDLLVEAFAVVRETAKRRLGQRHYDVQLIGGVVLHRGMIAEMKTGEGKTLVATLPTYLNALTGKGVHVVTVNDYLARRDPVWMGPVYQGLGLTVGILQHDSAYLYDPSAEEPPSSSPVTKGAVQGGMQFLKPVPRSEAYQADVLYGTNNEFGFDYLRDNMAVELAQRVQRERNYAIVDEVDNILIDEARTPLIISGPAEEPVQHYYTFAKLVPRFNIEEDYAIDERTQAISLTPEAIEKMEKWINVGNLYDPENYHLVHYIENAMTAYVQKKRDKDYVVRDGEVVIVDEFTGRLQTGRRWSDGLHQAIEAKEGIKIQRESVTYATITLQNYFRMYNKLAGMTGTAATESDEFYKIYGLEVAVMPTNVPMIRKDFADLVFQSDEAKWQAVVDDIVELNQEARPVLVGTTSVETSEALSNRLKKLGVVHQVLNAKNHQQEASIVAQAGRLGGVTVSTNMAGRGTDIVLGGSDTDRANWQEEHRKIIELGGLHVIGTEHHDARRVDNQLRGRSGRQGDPGSTQFYVSLEDELMQRFGGERIKSFMGWTGLEENVPIENKLITKSIGSAQIKVEGYHFDIRKHLLDYDDVLNNQRSIIYSDRERILRGDNLKDRISDMLRRELEELVRKHLSSRQSEDWNATSFISELALICPLPPELDDEDKVYQYSREAIQQILADHVETAYAAREEELGSEQMRTLERLLLLRAIDVHWVNHLTTMENLRTGIGLHAIGQRDPLVMYRSEGHKTFQELLARMQDDVTHTLFHVTVTRQPAVGQRSQAVDTAKVSPMQGVIGKQRQAAAGGNKVGRNASCPCGSGKKFKRCCGANG
ncbi:MAG: preprotein translocase subunit SecA [Chloroflexi bacterium]|nr:preprotein translocase subunit SecA [Chloroflexota bacterium]MDA1218963.1 preprotein translocase subunit SecA [Chloroflexota bacterium]